MSAPFAIERVGAAAWRWRIVGGCGRALVEGAAASEDAAATAARAYRAAHATLAARIDDYRDAVATVGRAA